MIQSYKNRAIEYDKVVHVYKNLTRNLYSIKQSDKVVAHATEIMLKDVEFRVNQNGRIKVLSTGNKNVHAILVGKIAKTTKKIALDVKNWESVTYNPKKHETFVFRKGLKPIYKTKYCYLGQSVMVLQ